VAGLTLAALAIPEVLGYAKIAGMPVVTGLYTMLVPLVLFAVVGSSRHLVVGADSATAAMLAAGLGGLAVAGSSRYVALAGTVALLAGGLLILARIVRLGFLANFLSRTVLVGFLTGVGVQVAIGQLPDMLGVHVAGGNMIAKLASLVRALPRVHPLTCVVSLAVIVVVLGLRMLARRIPGALIVVVVAIVVSRVTDLAGHGIAILGDVPSGLPRLGVPALAWSDLVAVLPIAASMFVVILAQSSATSRAYASRYGEVVDDDLDLVGLGAANVAAAFTGAFVVNGSPTKTEIVDSAGGRSQWSQLVTGGVVLSALFLTGPLAYLPLCVLAAVVFLIGAELVNIAGMRRIVAVRGSEFTVALVTATAVVVLGVEQGIVVAVVASIVDHLRHSYNPHSTVLRKSPEGHWRPVPVAAGERTVAGLVIYRFGSSLYFANAYRVPADVALLTGQGEHVGWFCLDAAAIGDVDYSAAAVLSRVQSQLAASGTRLVLANVIDPVRTQLDRYGFTSQVGHDAFFDTAGSTLEHFKTRTPGEHGTPATAPTPQVSAATEDPTRKDHP
jgi:high affinity sulfate transporter 1